MDERKLLALGVLVGAASGKPPGEWLSSTHEFFREQQRKDPMNATALAVLAGAAAFYAAERKDNPKVESFLDALVYASTNISVGYSDILARTELGKAVGSVLMTYGPAIAARAFDDPEPVIEDEAENEDDVEAQSELEEVRDAQPMAAQSSSDEQVAALRLIADRLEQILSQLQRA
jgi:voltage-gated potassium channel